MAQVVLALLCGFAGGTADCARTLAAVVLALTVGETGVLAVAAVGVLTAAEAAFFCVLPEGAGIEDMDLWLVVAGAFLAVDAAFWATACALLPRIPSAIRTVRLPSPPSMCPEGSAWFTGSFCA